MRMTHRSHETPKGSAAYSLLPKWREDEVMDLVVYAAVPDLQFFRDPDGLLRFKGDRK
jgi:hypothetical protein